MDIDFSDKTSQYYVEKMEVQGFTIQNLKDLRNQIYKDQQNIQTKSIKFAKQMMENYQQIYQYELNQIFSILLHGANYNSYQSFNFTNSPHQKLLKFFRPQYDYNSQIQRKALQIYRLLISQIQFKQLQQIELPLRVLRIQYFDEGDFEEIVVPGFIFEDILKNINKSEQGPNIIDMILKIKSLRIIQRLIQFDQQNQHTWLLTWYISQHIQKLNQYIKKLEQKKMRLNNETIIQLNKQILYFINLCLSRISSQYSSQDQEKYYIRCLSRIIKNIPCLQTSLKDIFINDNNQSKRFQVQGGQKSMLNSQLSQEEQLQNINQQFKQEFKSRLINSKIFFELYNYGKQQDSEWMLDVIFKIFNLMVESIQTKQFQKYITDLAVRCLSNQNIWLYSDKYEQLTKFLIQFIHLHQDTPQSQQLFIQVFCKSQVFDKLIDLAKKFINQFSINKMFSIPTTINYKKSCYQNLLGLTILIQEIIKNCKIITYSVRCPRHQTVQRSVFLIKQYFKNGWQQKVVVQMMEEMVERQRVNKRTYCWPQGTYSVEYTQ